MNALISPLILQRSLKKWGRFVFVLLLGSTLFSCGSYRSVSKKGTESSTTASGLTTLQAGQILGVEITRKDDVPLLAEAASWIGVPYQYGGTSKQGTDCSGLTRQIYRNIYSKNLPHNSQQQFDGANKKVKRGKLQQGDLVFFSPKKSEKRINHVGIYLKEGRFIHASSSKGVRIDFLADPYWDDNWISGGRYR